MDSKLQSTNLCHCGKGDRMGGVWIDAHKLLILSEFTTQSSWVSHCELVSYFSKMNYVLGAKE